MSFQKMNICESTEIAMNVFHMFRNGVVNQFYQGDDIVMHEPEWYPEHETATRPASIQSLTSYFQEPCTKMRVHDIKISGDVYSRVERRLVEFFLGSGMRKIVFSVLIRREYVDGDEVSGMSCWIMHSAELKVCQKKCTFGSPAERKGGTDIYKIRRHYANRDVALTPQMKKNFGQSFVEVVK